MADPAQLLEDVEHVILDFDGPICALYAGEPAADVAERLREFAARQQATSQAAEPRSGALQDAPPSPDAFRLPRELRLTDDPLDFLRLAGHVPGVDARVLADAVRDAEVISACSATATRGTAGVLAAARRSERALSIVSNGSREAVEAYLTEHGLLEHFETIEARAGSTESDATRLKPHPHLLLAALDGYVARHGGTADEARRAAVFVGDSVSDVLTAKAAGIRCIALANDSGKRRRFEEDSDATAVITGMQELADALNARWDAQWCVRQYCC
jgi:phosphoglycolate phosphatase-like HAD superfamily hydrolase